jgi:hypothetical protein
VRGAQSLPPIQFSNSQEDARPHSRGTIRPGLCQASLTKRGRGECRARERTRSPVCETKKHTSKSHHRYGRHPAFPARWFTAYSTLSPAIGLFVTVVGLDSVSINANLMPASRHQDHVASLSTRDISRQLMSRASIASSLTFRDDSAYVPLAEAGWGESIKLFLPFRETNYFFQRDWTTQITLKRLVNLDFWRRWLRPLPAANLCIAIILPRPLYLCSARVFPTCFLFRGDKDVDGGDEARP